MTTTTYHFNRVFAAACMGMLLFGIVIISLGTILPAITTKFDLTTIQAGSLASILPAGILLGSMLFGPIVDRYSYRWLLISCSLLIIIGLEGIAFAPGLGVLQISFFLIGAGGGALNGGTNALVADISEAHPDKRSANLSLLGVFFGIGALGVPSLMAALSAIWTYDQILTWTGGLIVFPLIYFALVSFPSPKQQQAIPLKASLSMIQDAHLLMFALFLFFESALEMVINNWTTSFLQDQPDVLLSQALVSLSIYVLSLTLSRLLLAAVLRRISPYSVLLISMVLLQLGALIMIVGQGLLAFNLGLVLLGIGTAAGFPVILGYVSELYTDLTGTAFSFVFLVALVGNMLINYLTGLLAHQFGIAVYPWVLLACTACLITIVIGRLRPIVNK